MPNTFDMVDNTIASGEPAYTIQVGDALIIEATIIAASNGIGVQTEGSNQLTVDGIISGNTALTDDLNTDGSSETDVGISGSILGQIYGAYLNNGSVVNNHGLISSNGISVLFYGTGNGTVNNFGTIKVNPEIGNSSAVEFFTSGLNILTNSGAITNPNNGAHAHAIVDDTATSTDRITNTGTIVGGIALGLGNDRYDGHLGHHSGGVIDMGAGNDTVYGGSDADSIMGGADNDLIRGGGGHDTMDGGDGTGDIADYTDKTVKVQVTLNGATQVNVLVNGVAEDKISNFEHVYGGSAGDALTGDTKVNILVGNGGNDSLNGGANNDALVGGAGSDRLTGGTGADHFNFNAALGATNIDTITDFLHGTDKIGLENNVIFAALGTTTGPLNTSMFVERAADNHAQNASQHIIYDKANGTLWYDSDGSGTAHAAIEFAVLGTTTHPALITSADFLVV